MYWCVSRAVHLAGEHGHPDLHDCGDGAVTDEMVGHVEVSEGIVTMQAE